MNGKEIAKHANFFHPCRVEVTDAVKAGKNLLVAHLDGGLFDVCDKPAEGWTTHLGVKLTKRHWLRKPQCQFGWDWSPRLINVGIHKSVSFEWASVARVDQFVPLAELSEGLSEGTVTARMFVEGLGKEAVAGRLTVEMPGLNVKAESTVEIKPGLGSCELTLSVPRPALWWPVGTGAQARHAITARLEVDGRIVGERTAKIGFRRVRVIQDRHPDGGRYFILEVNGRKIFAKGGNFVPADLIYARIDRERYVTLIDRALEANFNLLRVWGGGLYESDDFYDLCDERGVLVWQEFIFACARYPAHNEAFNESVKSEARHQVRRLASHPSLVVWCGNNEMEQGNWQWGFDKGVVFPDYGLFHLTLPRIMAEEDPTRYYQPSSPYSPDGLCPTRDDVGDQHPWSVGSSNVDFRDYRKMICRFPNEGGFLGPTALPTVLACLPEGQRAVQSFAWQVHDNSVDSWGEPSFPDGALSFWLGKDIRAMSVEEYVYWAGLLQGEALAEYIGNFRRRMYDSASAIFWMYNDCWPTVRSWTIVDYYLRRTPAFQPVRRAMAPVSVCVAVEGEEVVVFGVNDTDRVVEGDVRYGVLNLAGGFPVDLRARVALQPNASTRLASFKADRWGAHASSAAFAQLERKGELLARGRLLLPLFKEIEWAEAKLTVKVEGGMAVFESPVFAWGVCVDLDGERALADNFFDVWPGIPYRIPWTDSAPPKILGVGNLTRR